MRSFLPATLLTLLLAALLAAPAMAQRERGRDRDRDEDRDRGGQKGVTLYENEDYRGRSEFFTEDDPRLADNRIGNDRASSIKVDRGCHVTLYQDERFKGDSAVLEDDEPSLDETRVGNDSASSLTVRCAGRGGNTDGDYGWGDGVVLFANSDFRGRSQSFENDVRDLRSSDIGNDQASFLSKALSSRSQHLPSPIKTNRS